MTKSHFVGEKDAVKEMKAIGVHPGGISVMEDKSKFRLIKLYGVRNAIANIMKEEMLALGGDVARAYYAYKHSGKKIASATSIFLDRLLGFVAIITMALLGLLCFSRETSNAYIDYAVYGACGALVFAIAFFASRRFARLFKGLKFLIRGVKWKKRLEDVYYAIYGYRHHHPQHQHHPCPLYPQPLDYQSHGK